MPVQPVNTIITYAKISQFLAADDLAIQNLFRGGSLTNRLSRLIYIVRKQIQRAYTANPSDSTLDATANYLYWLCGKYINQAKVILGQGGSGTIVIPSTGIAATIVGIFTEFEIGDASSPLNAGDTILVLSYPNVIAQSVSVVLDGVVLPESDNFIATISYTIDYGPNSVTITFNNPVSNGQVYQIRGLQLISV